MFMHRTLEEPALAASAQFPVLLITGPRQVGKTTLLRHMGAENRTYVTLDDPRLLALAKEDPALFWQRFKPPVLVDEIQYAPELLPYIKMMVDNNPLPGQFWLTGSQPFHLMQGVSESLAGRVVLVQLLGMSERELDGREENVGLFLPTPDVLAKRKNSVKSLHLTELYHRIWRGSFPAIAAHPEIDWNLFYSSYVQTYLQRDVRDLAHVGNTLSFLRFLRASAARTGQLLNLSDLARDAGIAPNTAKHWLSILQASGIVYLLESFHTNATKRLVKAPKLYFLDTGLCAYLGEWTSPETLEAGAASGAFLETWILIELLKSYWHRGKHAPFYYFRDKDKKEIDLLIVTDGIIYPIEFKKTASPSKDDLRNFRTLESLRAPIGPGGVICLVEEAYPLSSAVEAIPVGLL